ncbi:hypothetical protein GCM10009039_09620 [Halocalculus aciditolerans]|uniref:DUF502 domain-containing protein n=2 Tax=Halocalculus aciditolerans TaxID=1383812 RepID=A0A830F472_9EURY|nr:hypothetical protein GCM10009039_09620 [Halocalculus aciditolerans]
MQEAGESIADRIRESALTGIAIIVPLLITLYVFVTGVNLLSNVLDPIADLLIQASITPTTSRIIVEIAAVTSLAVLTLGLGFVATFKTGEQIIGYFDKVIERIPGLGSVYTSFRQMSDVMVESDANNFQEVKLVEYPHEGTYTLGFETTKTPEPIREAARDDSLRTLFLPLAPNPVMGGFLSHIPEDRIMDVDMSVEEGMRAVITTGVAVAETDSSAGLSREELTRLSGADVTDAMAATNTNDTDEDEPLP